MLSARGTPRFRVHGERTMRWFSMSFPFAIVMSVKRADDAPLAGKSVEAIANGPVESEKDKRVEENGVKRKRGGKAEH